MALSDDLKTETDDVFTGRFTVLPGRVIPSIADIPFGNQGRQLRLVSLFVDIRKSTRLVDAIGVEPAARMYKAYLRGVTKIVGARDGDILSFNGDGVVCGFVGPNAENNAVLAGLNIVFFCRFHLGPSVQRLLPAYSDVKFDFGIGIEVGEVFVVRGGIRGDEKSDLVWAGKPVNYSVKINSLAAAPYNIYMSHDVMSKVHHELFFYKDGQNVWEGWNWADKDQLLWRSNWWFGTEYLRTAPGPVQLRLPPAPSGLAALLDAGPRRRSIFDSAPPAPDYSSLASIFGSTPRKKPTPIEAIIAASIASRKKQGWP